MVIPVSHLEIYGSRPTNNELNSLLVDLKTEPTIVCLAMWSLLLSLFENRSDDHKFLQGFFVHHLIREEIQQKVLDLANLEAEDSRPVFGRWQLIALMKSVLIESSLDVGTDPRKDGAARQNLGDACLILNDLLFTNEQMERLAPREGVDERERIHDELMTQWIFQSELLSPPDVFQALARNLEYLSIFDSRTTDFEFSDGKTLAQRFRDVVGLELRQYLMLYFSIFVLYNRLKLKSPIEINSDPSVMYLDKDRVFALMDVDVEEREAFFNKVITDVSVLVEGAQNALHSNLAWQFDFTGFREHPLVYSSPSRQKFSCFAIQFLIEKLATGFYHTLFNSWPSGDENRSRFQTYWGKVFEQFVNDRLRHQFPPTLLIDRLHTNPYFERGRNRSTEVCDAVINYGNSLVLMEHKGGYLSLQEKYGDDASTLLTGIADKFGLEKAITQLSRSIGLLFTSNREQSDIFSERSETGERIKTFPREALDQIQRVYPVLIVQDFSLAMGFVGRRLRTQFREKMAGHSLMTGVHVRPLLLLTIEDLENLLEYLQELLFTEVLDDYARDDRSPLTTFNEVFSRFLHAKGITNIRRNRWSVNRCRELMADISRRFTDLEGLSESDFLATV